MTPTARAAVLVGAAALSVLIVGIPLGLLLTGGATAAILADALLVRRPPSATIEAPPILARGHPGEYRAMARAESASRVDLRQPVPPDLVMDPSGGVGVMEGELLALRRGRHELPQLATRSVGPLGLGAWHHATGEPRVITVYPDVVTARRLARAVATGRFRDEGRRRQGRIGIGTEFDAVRDYDPNDDVRFVNWPATLRLGRPMTNQYRVDQDRDVICLIDAGRLMAAPVGELTRLDAAVDATAALAYVADELGDRVGVVAFAGEVLRDVAPRRRGGDLVIQAVHDLEPVPAESDYEVAFRKVGRAKRAFVVLFTDLLEEAAAAPLLDALPVLARRHAVVVAFSTDEDLRAALTDEPESLRDVLRSAVAVDALDAQAAVVGSLARRGIRSIEAPRGQLPEACVAAYVEAKARARL